MERAWKQKIVDQRSSMRNQHAVISKAIIEKLRIQMAKDKELLKNGTFKTQNDHNVSTNLDEITFFPIYKPFILNIWNVEWAKKSAHKANWHGSSLDLYTIKMRRFVFMTCYDFLQKEKVKFFANDENDE